jgi:Flp pilus assembly protein TadG
MSATRPRKTNRSIHGRLLRRPNRSKHRRGAAVVELALVSPFLAVLLLGICEVGQAMRVEAILATAARSACAAASSPSGTNALALAEVNSILESANLPSESASVQVFVNDALMDAASAVANDKITVTVKLPTSVTRSLGASFYSAPDSQHIESTTMLRQ